jgi:hypothetical protein
MKINTPDDDDPIDPISLCPEQVVKKIQTKTEDLTFFLSSRANFWKERIDEGAVDGEDFSTIALVESLAFYETMIDALVLRQTHLEERLGGNGLDAKN